MASNGSMRFPNGSYRDFRAFADPAGLEALDSSCDLVTSKGLTNELGSVDISEGNATNAWQPLVGMRTVRAVDRFRLTLTSIKTVSGHDISQPPPLFSIAIRLSHGACGDQVDWQGVVQCPSWNSTGLIVQLSGLSFDTVELWGGTILEEAVSPGGEVRVVFRCFVYRCGADGHDAPDEIEGELVQGQ